MGGTLASFGRYYISYKYSNFEEVIDLKEEDEENES